VISAIDARHDQVYYQVVAGGGDELVAPQVAPVSEALAATRFGAVHLVGNAAQLLAERWPIDAEPPVSVQTQAAPDITWIAWLGAAADPERASARPFYLRAPDVKLPAEIPHAAAQTAAS
jgi:tRNA A37 threonylcarbamoyladenosine modification protein TsaB